MAKASGINNTLAIAETFIQAAQEALNHTSSYADGLLDVTDQLINNEGVYIDGDDNEYELTSANNSGAKLKFEDMFEGEDGVEKTERSINLTGKNLDSDSENAELTSIKFDNNNSFKSSSSSAQEFNSVKESNSGKATVSYTPFSGSQEGLSRLVDIFGISESYSRTSNSKSSEGTFRNSQEASFNFKGHLTANSGDLNGTVNALGLSYESSQKFSGSQEGKQRSEFALSSKAGITLDDGSTSGNIDSLSLSSKSNGLQFNREVSIGNSNFSYEGNDINANVLASENVLNVASKLFAGDDILSGTDNAGDYGDYILGFAGSDSYRWDSVTGGEDTVNLSRYVPNLTLGGNEEIDTVAVSGASKSGQIRVSFVSAEVGNGVASDVDNDSGPLSNDANEDGGLAVRLQLENADGLATGTIGRFDDEGMLFTAKSGTFDVRDLNAGTQRGDQFKTVFLGTSNALDVQNGTEKADYMNGGAGTDILSGGKGNDFLVGGSGNDTLNGGKGNDSFLGGSGNDFIVINKGDSGLKVVKEVLQADTVLSFASADDTLVFDVKIGGYSESSSAVNSYAAALAAATSALAEMGKTDDKSALFNFQFSNANETTTGYLFEDYTGDGKIDQVIVFAGINNTGIDGLDITGLFDTTGASILIT